MNSSTTPLVLPLTVFVDDGCSAFSLIDSSFVSTHQIPTIPLATPYSISAFDGSVRGHITHKTRPLVLQIGTHTERLSFLVAPLNSHAPIITGLPWMRKHNPLVNWRTLTISFGDSSRAVLLPTSDSTPSPPQQPPTCSTTDVELLNDEEFFSFAQRNSLDIFVAHMNVRSPTGKNKHTVSLNAVLTTKEYAKTQIPVDSRGVPLKYKAYQDVFNTKTDPTPTLAPHRPYDLAIEFVRDAEGKDPPLPTPGKIYPLSPPEEVVLSEFLSKSLSRNWISPSTSPLASPCFFVRKPNGGFRLCVDYRRVNWITKKNRYPLPLTQDLLDKLGKSRLYTHLDLPDAYHLVRIKKGDEWKTAFRCKFGQFEFNVIPFGLSNAPAAFQYFLNDIFSDMLGVTVVIYLDDILIFSENEDLHKQHVKAVLERLRQHQLFVNPSKCSFHLSEVDFLGMIVSADGIKMDPAKVEAVANWPAPASVKDIQMFLGFANFYRRFVLGFSDVAKPLTSLTRKTVPFDWSTVANDSFLLLKKRFSSAPTLSFFDFNKPAIVETDASDFGISAILSQYDDHGVLHPVAFHSRQLTSAEINYDTHDKELLAIVDSFLVWRHYLVAADPDSPTLVLSDHHNLERFMSALQLSRRQFRWAQILSDFHFKIHHRPGRLNGKADILSRRSDLIDSSLKATNYLQLFQRISLDAISIISSDPVFLDQVKKATATSDLLQHFHDHTLTPEYTFRDGFLWFQDLLVLPNLDLQLDAFHRRHSAAVAGHFGLAKTLELLARDFHWPRMRHTVRRFIANCDTCSRAKSSRHAPFGKLHPLPVPAERWWDISIDFITDLSLSSGFDSIMVVKDRLSKQAHFVPTHKCIDAPKTADLFLQHVFRLHGSPRSIVSDRGPQFVSTFWRRFHSLLGTSTNLSSAFHPETDGSTEVTNQVIEQYLRIYCNYQQSDWAFPHLTLAEFAYNNTINSSTGMTPFFANTGHHPLFDPTLSREPLVPAAEERIRHLQTINEDLQANLRHSQAAYTASANAHRLPAPPLQVGDLVFLDRRNIKTSRPSNKLDHKKLGPFKIKRIINPVAFELQLPATMKVHPVFHVSLLQPRTKDVIPALRPAPPPPVIVAGHEEYKVHAILDSRRYRNRLRYLVRWEGYDPSADSWEPAVDLFADVPDLVNEFHRLHPQKPRRSESDA